jgi:membrane associated rhomboid family serine protease
MASSGALPGSQQNRYKKRHRHDDDSEGDAAPGWWDNSVASPKRQSTQLSRRASHRGIEFDPDAEEAQPTAQVIYERAPLIWTIGIIIIGIIAFACSIYQYGGFVSMKSNPLYGPDQSTLLQLGAKYGPLILDGEPWRLFTAPFIHSGIIHIIIAIAYVIATYNLERKSGFFKTVFLYFLSSIYGLILSCIFVSTLISCGFTGAAGGYILFLICDLISTWSAHKRPFICLIALIIGGALLILIGLTPYVDNFTHVGGMIMGFLFGLISLPNMSFGKSEKVCRIIIALAAFPTMSLLFMVCLVIFFRRVDSNMNWCKWCLKINCLNFSGWCPSTDYAEEVVV